MLPDVANAFSGLGRDPDRIEIVIGNNRPVQEQQFAVGLLPGTTRQSGRAVPSRYGQDTRGRSEWPRTAGTSKLWTYHVVRPERRTVGISMHD